MSLKEECEYFAYFCFKKNELILDGDCKNCEYYKELRGEEK